MNGGNILKSISSKEIKKYILNYNDLDALFEYLNFNYKETIDGIFNALYILLKNPDKNKSQIEYLILILKEQLNRNSAFELKKLIGPIIDIQNKISTFKLKERIRIKKYSIDIQNLFTEINIKITNLDNNKKIKYLEFLIFNEKNMKLAEQFIKENKELLIKNTIQNNQIFLKILKNYITSNNSEEIDYLYNIIVLFLKSEIGEQLLKNQKQYLKLCKIENITTKPHILKLMKLIDPSYTIDKEELEERHQIHFTFPNIILNEIDNFTSKNIARQDFTYQECLTIDGEETICYDDAIYIEKNSDNTYTLYIHIIDIPSQIPYTSMTREEASYREETIYLSDKNLLLYPSSLSNNLCSLIPNNKRNTLTYIFKLDKNFKVVPSSFLITPGIINVKNRLTYDEADTRINEKIDTKLDNTLNLLSEFSQTQRKETEKKELYRNYENILFLEPHHESIKIDYSPSANIIHESMILVNYYVAKYCKDHCIPYIYRKINIPSEELIEESLKRIKSLGTNLEKNKEFISNLKDSYTKAIYCKEPTYHKGLNLECYSHSTSPARRYIDSLGQYIIHDIILENNSSDKFIYTWEYRINNAIEHANKKKKQNELFINEYNYLSRKKLMKEK